MQYAVIFTPEAQEQLAELYRYIAVAASPEIAQRYTNAIVTYCEGLQDFPHRGICRDDVRLGLRIKVSHCYPTTYRFRIVSSLLNLSR